MISHARVDPAALIDALLYRSSEARSLAERGIFAITSAVGRSVRGERKGYTESVCHTPSRAPGPRAHSTLELRRRLGLHPIVTFEKELLNMNGNLV